MKRLAIFLVFLLLSATASYGQGGRLSADPVVTDSLGRPRPGVNIAVCAPLATTAASVTSNLAVLTMASNPIIAGFVAGMSLTVAGFTAGDTYFNGGYTILSVTATTITYSLTHANASAGTNGTALQTGNTITSCAGLATVYTDITLATPGTNPFTADGLGNYGAWVAPGPYWVQSYGQGIATTMKRGNMACVPSATIGNCGAQLNGTNAWTGNETHSGTETFGSLNGVRVVDGTKFTTVTAAYADLPARGGTIYIPSGTSLGSNPVIDITTAGKPARLVFDAGVYALGTGQIHLTVDGSTIEGYNAGGLDNPASSGYPVEFSYSGTGAAIFVEGVNANGIQGVKLSGFLVEAVDAAVSSANAIGIQLAGALYTHFDDVSVLAFHAGIGIQVIGNSHALSSTNYITNPRILSCKFGIYTGTSGGNSAFHTIVEAGFIGAWASVSGTAYGIQFDSTGGDSNRVIGTDIEGYATATSAGIFVAQGFTTLIAPRLEGNYYDIQVGAVEGTQIISPSHSNTVNTAIVDVGTNTLIIASKSSISDVSSTTKLPSISLTETAKALVNGLNSDINVGSSAFVRISGPTGVFSVGGFTAPTTGRMLYLFNNVPQTMTIVNEDASSTAANRISTLTGGNVVLRAGAASAATFIYDFTGNGRWILVATN